LIIKVGWYLLTLIDILGFLQKQKRSILYGTNPEAQSKSKRKIVVNSPLQQKLPEKEFKNMHTK
jgi:hypothetical protein